MFTIRSLISCALLAGISSAAPASRNEKRQFPSSFNIPPSVNMTLVAQVLKYEYSTYVTGPIYNGTMAVANITNDPFYQAPPGSASAAPGSLLKMQDPLNSSLYTLPPDTAISRFMYQSANSNNTGVPASAYVLWPFAPRPIASGKVPLVVFAHGTSGLYSNCGPSHTQDLLQNFAAPFTLAMAGYAVVGIDYAGLGVQYDSNGQFIPHQYLVEPVAANDVVYAVEAAQKAFPTLSDEWAVIGHSEGGGCAWATAEREATDPTPGYLGAVAVAPVTNSLSGVTGDSIPLIETYVTQSIRTVFPAFEPTDLIAPIIQQGLDYIQSVGGCSQSAGALLQQLDYQNTSIVNPDWTSNPYAAQFKEQFSNGGKNISGPLLVIKGLADATLSVSSCDDAVNQTVAQFPDVELEYYQYPDVDHTPSLSVSMQQWLPWIGQRFDGVPAGKYCGPKVVNHTRSAQAYEKELDYVLTLQPAAG